MKALILALAGLLLQATPGAPDAVPFESAGTIIFASFAAVRPSSADKNRAFETESGRLNKFLRIPPTLEKELQVGLYCWIRGTEKDGIVEPSEAIVFPGEGVLRIFNSPQPEKIAVRFISLGGGCDHMPAIKGGVTCKPVFAASLAVVNDREEAATIEIERVFWSAKKDEIGIATGRVRPKLQTENGMEAVPPSIPARQTWRIALGWPLKSEDCPDVRPTVTVVLKIGGERVFVRAHGEFSISR